MKVTNHQVCFFCRFSKLLRKSFDMQRNYLQRNGKLCSETSGNLLNFQRPRFSTFGQHYPADKYLGNQLRYPVDREEKSWRGYDHTIHDIKTSWLSTSFPGFSPTRPTERERAGRREPWERGCLPLSPALAAKLWIHNLFTMTNSFYQLNKTKFMQQILNL